MGQYNYLQLYLWSEKQNDSPKIVILFSAKTKVLISLLFNFSSL